MNDPIHVPAPHATEGARPASPPDERNPAIIDAEHPFVATLLSAALFIGAVFVFIL